MSKDKRISWDGAVRSSHGHPRTRQVINVLYICPHGHPRTKFLVHFHHFQFPRTTGHGHPRSAFGSHGQPRTTAFFVKILKLFASPRPRDHRTQSRIHAGSSIQHSRACAGSTQDPSWDCVCPAAASLGLAVWDFRTGGGTGKIPSLILRLTLPACSVRWAWICSRKSRSFSAMSSASKRARWKNSEHAAPLSMQHIVQGITSSHCLRGRMLRFTQKL